MARAPKTQAAQVPAPAVAPAPSEARALIDLPAHGVRCGCLLVADTDVIAALADAGAVDTHPDAIAAAKAQA